MAKYKQNRADRLDESLGMRNGPARKMKQDYKDRRDEHYGMKNRKGDLGHDKKPMMINAVAAQQKTVAKLKKDPMNSMGYPKQAFDYKY